jgi:methionyl-tRNA synthetase
VSADGDALLEHLHDALPAIAELYAEREYGKALRETMLLADRVNAYVDQNKPWELAKQSGMEVRLHDVCTTCIQAFRLLTTCLKPVLPALAAQVEAFLNVAPLTFDSATQRLPAGHAIGEYKHLMQRVEQKQLDALFEAPPAPEPEKILPGGEEIAPVISIDDFSKIDPSHRPDRRVRGGRGLDQAAAPDAGRRRGSHPQRVLRYRQRLQARGVGRQAHRDGGQSGAAQDEVRCQ